MIPLGMLGAASPRAAVVAGGLSDAILARNPWVYYKLDETGTLSTASDSSGNARDGTYAGSGTTDVSGLFGGSTRAKTFNGSGAVTGPTFTASAGSPFSVMSCFSFTSTGMMALFSGDNVSSPARMFQFRVSSGFVQFLLLAPSTVTLQTPSTYNDGNPHMGVIVYDESLAAGDGRMKIYVDGSEVARSTTAVTNSQTSAPLAAAQLGSGSTLIRLTGSLDECAFFDYALTASDVAAIWAARDTP